MRTLITLITTLSLSFAVGCSKDREDSDVCGRAISNAERLATESAPARERWGARPITRAECETASSAQISCAAYASDWNELERCAPSLVR